MRRTAILLIASLLLAGCSDSGGDSSSGLNDAAVTSGPLDLVNMTVTAPPRPITLELSGCLQLHTFFPIPTAVFGQLGFELPPGFGFSSSNGATVDVFLAWWFCPSGVLNNSVNGPFGDVGSMFAAMPVIPPGDLVGRDPRAAAVQLDLVPLTWVLSQRLASEHLGRIEGLRDGYVEFGEVSQTLTTNTGVATAYGATAPASFGSFDVDAFIQASPAQNPEGRYRMWLTPEAGDIRAYLDISNSAGNTLGSGAADLRFVGDLDTGAPPIIGGTSHVVDATNVVVSLVELA